MATVTTTNLFEAKYADIVQTTQYTATNVKTIIDKYSVTNISGAGVTFVVNLCANGTSASSSNKVLSKTIAAGQTYNCPELVGQVLNSGDFISTIAGSASALVMRASGREIS